MSKKLTPWFPARVKPARVGYYQIACPWNETPALGGRPALWNGYEWRFSHKHGMPLFEQSRPWRGLAEKP